MDMLLNAISASGVTSEDVDKARSYQQKAGGAIEQVLINMGSLSEDQLPDVYAAALGEPRLDDDAVDKFEGGALELAEPKHRFLVDRGWIPLFCDEEAGDAMFATTSSLDREAIEFLSSLGISFRRTICSRDEFEGLVSKSNSEVGHSDVASENLLTTNEEDRLRELATEAPTVNLLNRLISRALKMRASDIHIEPSEKSVLIRYRIDGVLQDAEKVQSSLQLPLVSRVKILAGMDIAERRRPQDGKIELKISNTDLDIRVSALPLQAGESVVMRLLRKDAISYSFDSLELLSDTRDAIKRDLAKTTGVILMTGPTGSGKTTSLYSFLGYLNKPGVKIITLEDPVEYQLPGLNQVQVRPDLDFDFGSGLRSIVRQDPDVIMVGEIRDQETCRIALQAALTGHLVFSTVHTNDAASAFTRLLDLGVPEYLLNAALLSVMAQRLVRRVCSSCAVACESQDDVIEEYQLHNLITKFDIDEPKLMTPVGCEACNFTGYLGRIAIIEYLQVEDSLKALPKDDQFLSNAQKLNSDRGFRSLFEDGMLRALRGETTPEEVARVCG